MEPGMEVLTVTKSEVIKEFFKKSVLPVAVAALLKDCKENRSCGDYIC